MSSTLTSRIGRYSMQEQPRRYACARCGHYSTADRMVFSTWTRNRFCADIGSCEKRARRRARKEA